MKLTWKNAFVSQTNTLYIDGKASVFKIHQAVDGMYVIGGWSNNDLGELMRSVESRIEKEWPKLDAERRQRWLKRKPK